MNQVMELGRLTRPAELKYHGEGNAIANFSIAVNRTFKNKETGEYDSDFFNCVAYGVIAEQIAKNISKGDRLLISGRLQSRTYENRNGQRVFVTEIVVIAFEYIEKKREYDSVETKEGVSVPNNVVTLASGLSFQANHERTVIDLDDDDLPF